MNSKDKRNLEVLRNYLEKAVYKTMNIEARNWKLDKINAELVKLIELVDEIEQ